MEEKKITFEDIQKANKIIKPMKIKRKDKQTGKTIAKDYAEVNQRIKAFRMVYPRGAILPELISEIDGILTFKVEIKDEDGYTLSIAHAREKINSNLINQTNALENCETSAVGRALGMCGFGVDSSLSSAEEVQNAIDKQEELQNGPMTEEQLFTIAGLEPKLLDHIRDTYKKDPTTLTQLEAETCIKSLKKNGLLKTKEQKEKEKKEKEEVF